MAGTKDALQQAYTGEAKAALRLKVYAEKAEEEGYPQMAKLFRVIAWSEEIHGARALRVLKEIEDILAEMKVEKAGEGIRVKNVPNAEILSRCYELGITMAEKVHCRL